MSNNTDKKISALKTLCDMLKNSNSSEEENNTEEETVNSESATPRTSNTEEKVDIDDLRAKIRQAQTDMKEEKKRDNEKTDGNSEEDKPKSKFSEEFQNYFMYFLSNPNSFNQVLGQISETIETTVDSIDPNSIINSRKPVKVQKYYHAANLAAVYMEMLKLTNLRIKQSMDISLNNEDFDIVSEAKTFNNNLLKIWNLQMLILGEMTALRLNEFKCSQSACSSISFTPNGLFQISQYDLKKSMEKCGFKTDNDNNPKLETIILNYDDSIGILKKTIFELQNTFIHSIKLGLTFQYQQIANNIEVLSNNLGNTKYETLMSILCNLLEDPSTNTINTIRTIKANSSGTDLEKFLADNTHVDLYDILTDMLNLVSDIYGIIQIFKYDLNNTQKLNQLGLNYNITTSAPGLDPVSLQTDSIIGLQYITLNVLRISPTLVRSTQTFFKSFLCNALYSTTSTPSQITSGVISYNQIINSISSQHQNKQNTGAYNPLSNTDYFETPAADLMPLSTNPSTISVAGFNTLIEKTYACYGNIIDPIFNNYENFKKNLSNVGCKNILNEKRLKLVRLLRLFENQMTSGLAFFAEITRLWNASTNPNLLNAQPQSFNSSFLRGEQNFNGQEANQARARQTNAQAEEEARKLQAEQEARQAYEARQAQQARANPSPAQTNNRNVPSPLNEIPSNHSSSTDESEEEDDNNSFKLPDQPTSKHFYSGSKKNYS